MTTRDPAGGPDTMTWGGGHASPTVDGLPSRWRLERPLGRGGQAEVWLARDTELDQWVALKIFHGGLDDAWRERMRREVRIGRELAHPGLVRVFELIEGEGSTAVAMEWVDGQTVVHRVAEGPLPIAEVVELSSQLLEVLAHLHQRGVIHRDLKPSNILLQPDGRVRLADLGLARPLEGALDVTRTEQAVGTPAYMSPEQLRGEALSPASDLYGLGATLFHALTGAPPYEGESGFSVADGHLRAAIPNPRSRRPDCPRWLARFIRRLLEKRPADRWLNAAAALAAFSSRRRLVSPRIWRRVAALAIGVSLIAWAAVAALDARRGPTHSAHVAGDELVILDDIGRELWRERFAGFTVHQSLVVNLVGDDEAEVAVSLREDGEPPASPSQFRVFSRGRLIDTIEVGAHAASRYPRQWNVFAAPQLSAVDTDGDGRDELAWLARKSHSYSSELGIADLRRGRVGPVFTNAGHLHSAAAADLDGDGVPELVTAGINNLLGYQIAVAILHAVPAASSSTHVPASSPDDLVTWRQQPETASAARQVLGYILLDVFDGAPRIERVGPDGIVLRTFSRTLVLDAAGNPEGSVLFGKGAQARLRFWDELVDVCYGIEAGTDNPYDAARAFLGGHREVIAEDAMDLAAVLLLARSLSRAGEPTEAAAILLSASGRHTDSTDLWIKRATYQAAEGNTGAALASLDSAGRIGLQTSRTGEALYQMIRLAAAAGDSSRFERAIEQWSTKFTGPVGGERHTSARALWAFFRGEWQDPSLAGGNQPDPGFPEIHVVSAWAELERSGNAEQALVRARELASRPDLCDLVILLEAEALARQGELARASALAVQAHSDLDRLGREELIYHLWAPLADHVAAKALAAEGRHAEAAALYARSAAAAPHCWFGQPPTNR